MRLIGRCFISGVLVLLALLMTVPPAFALDGQLAITEVRASAFPQVTIRLTVSSSKGEPLPILTSEDFVVEENGKSVGNVSAYPLYQSPTPLAVVMVFDVSGSMNDEGKLAGAKAAAKTFVSQLRAVDRVEIVKFSDQVDTVVTFTNNRTVLNRAIDGLAAKGNTAIYDAADRAVNDVLRVSGTRLVVLLTDGDDDASRTPISSPLDLAKQSQVPIYTIGLGSDVKDDILTRVATETGGHYFKAPKADDLANAFALLQEELAHDYELTYISPLEQAPGQSVQVALRVPRAGASLQGSFTYLIPAGRRQAAGPIDPGQLHPVIEPTPVLNRAPQVALPDGPTPLIAALLAAAAVLTLLMGISLRTTRDRAEERLATFVSGISRSARRGPDDEPAGRLLPGLLTWLAGAAGRLLPANQVEQIRRNLVLAGNPYGWGVQEFLGVRMLAAIGCGLVGYLYGAPRGVLGVLVGVVVMGLLGFLLPVTWLGSKVRKRQRAIFRQMPNALDLISVSVEAGLGFDQALMEVCQKWQNELTREFTLFLSEVRMGRDRREALRAIAERTGVPELNGFIGAILQADELGSGIARTLQIQAEQMRMKRRQAAEKLAHEAAIKMLLPMVFLIFPAIFVVILGPAVPLLMSAFSKH